MSEQEKDGWKKRQVSYDPKDEAILDPIFAEAKATDNPNRNPSQNFNGSDYFEASVRDVPLHTTFIVPAFLAQSGHRANSSFHRRIIFVPLDLFFQFILQYLHRIHCYVSLKYAYEYGLKNLHLMGYPVHGLSFDNGLVGFCSLIPQSISRNFTKRMIHPGYYVIKV
jgi:hypothetical protein